MTIMWILVTLLLCALYQMRQQLQKVNNAVDQQTITITVNPSFSTTSSSSSNPNDDGEVVISVDNKPSNTLDSDNQSTSGANPEVTNSVTNSSDTQSTSESESSASPTVSNESTMTSETSQTSSPSVTVSNDNANDAQASASPSTSVDSSSASTSDSSSASDSSSESNSEAGSSTETTVNDAVGVEFSRSYAADGSYNQPEEIPAPAPTSEDAPAGNYKVTNWSGETIAVNDAYLATGTVLEGYGSLTINGVSFEPRNYIVHPGRVVCYA